MPIQYATAASFRSLDSSILGPVLRTLVLVSWPCSRYRVMQLVSDLGWTITAEGANICADTMFPLNWTLGSFILLDDGLSQLTSPVSDAIAAGDSAAHQRMSEMYGRVIQAAESILGPASDSRMSGIAETWWDIGSGGRIHIDRLSRFIQLQLMSARSADVERFGETHDMSEYPEDE